MMNKSVQTNNECCGRTTVETQCARACAEQFEPTRSIRWGRAVLLAGAVALVVGTNPNTETFKTYARCHLDRDKRKHDESTDIQSGGEKAATSHKVETTNEGDTMLIGPLNDVKCLGLAHGEAKRLASLPWFRERIAQFGTTGAYARHIRSLEQRDDLGDPNDGPRIPCDVSQRLRYGPIDPNCFERVVDFLAATLILAPHRVFSSASLVMDQGWHTFPVEIRDGLPRVIVLDPIAPPTNAMLATAYRAGKTSPLAKKHLVPWFNQVARNACIDDGGDACYECAIDSLRNAVIAGEPLEDLEDLEYVLERAAEDAEMWGGQGRAAADQVYRSVRNLSFKLNTGFVKKFVKKLARTAEQLAPHAIKAALVAELGPAAGVALQGVDLAVAADKAAKAKQSKQRIGTLNLDLESSRKTAAKTEAKTGNTLLRRMTLGFR